MNELRVRWAIPRCQKPHQPVATPAALVHKYAPASTTTFCRIEAAGTCIGTESCCWSFGRVVKRCHSEVSSLRFAPARQGRHRRCLSFHNHHLLCGPHSHFCRANARESLLRAHASSLLARLAAMDNDRFFTEPVDPAAVPNYTQIIQQPMCFRTMQDVSCSVTRLSALHCARSIASKIVVACPMSPSGALCRNCALASTQPSKK